jgi:hypothetical protein
MNERHNERIMQILQKKDSLGATVSELITETHLTRDNIRIAVAALEGGRKIISREVGRAKLYRILHA